MGCSIYDEDQDENEIVDITENDGAMPGNARTIAGYGSSTGHDFWAFIASPVDGSIEATTVSNLVAENANEFDLYRFNPSVELEWENWKQVESDNYHFTLMNGRGYLYGNKETTELVFSGTFNMAETMEVQLTYDQTASFAGWNLVGNPFPRAAYIDKSYYKLNDDGSVIVAEPVLSATYISPCHGVFVQVDGNETVTFRTTAPTQQNATNNGLLNITVAEQKPDTRGASTGSATAFDNAIVSFNKGTQLGKFYFGKQNANISIPQGGKEYAIAYSEGHGEMPLNFKANKNGTYTLTVKPEGVALNYLHLIDNMTGADVDLLAASAPELVEGPNVSVAGASTSSATSYTFTAKKTDYESRFRLVFVANGEDGSSTGSETFAFINASGNLTLFGIEGKATLQVIDMMGHVLSSETFSGNYEKKLNVAPGVYVLRLINGKDVKTQKIIVVR